MPLRSYKHRCIGIIPCRSDFEIEKGWNHLLPISILEEKIPVTNIKFSGKKGDIILGGFTGEFDALRISLPEAIHYMTNENWDAYIHIDEIFKSYWTSNTSFIFGNGFIKSGWNPHLKIELWLIEHIISFLIKIHPEEYRQHMGHLALEEDGNICRIPTEAEADFYK